MSTALRNSVIVRNVVNAASLVWLQLEPSRKQLGQMIGQVHGSGKIAVAAAGYKIAGAAGMFMRAAIVNDAGNVLFVRPVSPAYVGSFPDALRQERDRYQKKLAFVDQDIENEQEAADDSMIFEAGMADIEIVKRPMHQVFVRVIAGPHHLVINMTRILKREWQYERLPSKVLREAVKCAPQMLPMRFMPREDGNVRLNSRNWVLDRDFRPMIKVLDDWYVEAERRLDIFRTTGYDMEP